MSQTILLVDDDADILAAHQRTLRKQFTVRTAQGPSEGLAAFRDEGPFAVVVSDMQMPGMNGIRFLAEAQTLAPETVRMMLTGFADVKTAMEAVNEGAIFRFLTKPCPPEAFVKALQAGLDQYRLVTAERQLLEQTLKGSVKVLSDVLSMVNPAAFGRASRVRDLVTRMGAGLRYESPWELEVAALLSQLGCVTLPEDTLAKVYRDPASLGAREKELFDDHPRIAHDLLGTIPRLDRVATIIRYQEKRFDGGGVPRGPLHGAEIPLGARILKVALDFDMLMVAGKRRKEALEKLRDRPEWYDATVLEALATVLREEAQYVQKAVGLSELLPGMIFAKDVRSTSGLLIVTKGQELTPSLRIRLKNLAEYGTLPLPLQVFQPLEKAWRSAAPASAAAPAAAP